MKTHQFPAFDLSHLLRTIFNPLRGENVCILIDLDDPEDVVDFAFLQNVDLTIPRKAYASFYRELHNGVMQQLGLGRCDFYAFETTGEHNRELPDAVLAPDGNAYILEQDIYPAYDIFLCITSFEASAPLAAAAKKHNFRGAAMHGLNSTILRTGLSVDYEEVSRETEILRKGMTHANSLEIDFEVDLLHYHLHIDLGLSEAHKSDGLCHIGPGIVNLPAGEVYFIPQDATGSFPIQFEDETLAIMHVDRKRVHTVTLIRGNPHIASEWQRRLDRNPSMGTLVEFSLGTQTLPFSGSEIQDEKILGTFQLGLGRNTYAQPRCPLHTPLLFSPHKTPEILVKHIRMKREGRLELLFENYQPAPYLRHLLT